MPGQTGTADDGGGQLHPASPQTPVPRAGLLVFDGDCGFCTSAVRITRRWISRDVTAVPWQRADLDALGLDERSCRDAVQYRDQRGSWSAGGRAVSALLREGQPPWPWLGRLAGLPGIAWLVDRTYEWVARNRHRLPGGLPACQSPEQAG